MYWDENEAAATAPTMPTVKQVIAPSATEATLPEAAITEVRPTSERPGFLLILLRALSAWGT